MALVAIQGGTNQPNGTVDTSELLGVGRLVKRHGKAEAEFALLVADKAQRQGLGTELLRRLLQVGRDEYVQRIVGNIPPDNQKMQTICEKKWVFTAPMT